MEATKHPHIIPQSYPWLVIADGKNLERQTLVNISNNHFDSGTIPKMHNKSICSSSKEWLVLKDIDSMDLCLLSLTSKEVVKLPRLQLPQFDFINDLYICILSSPPNETNHDYYVMFIDGSTSKFYFCQPGEKEFSEQVFEFDSDDRLKSIVAATMFREKVYFLTWFSGQPPIYELFTAEFVGSNLHFTKFTRENFPQPSPPEIDLNYEYLVECGGKLLYIHKMRGGWNGTKILGFLIFQMDFSSRVWVQVNNIGGWTIFLSQYHGLEHKAISCFAEKGIRQNAIYFTKSFDRLIYVFDLEDRSISKSLSCPIVSKYKSRLDWVMVPNTKP